MGSITHCDYIIDSKDTAEQISDKLCFKSVHHKMKFKNDKNKIMKTWQPTLCPTLDYHYLYRIGGGDPLKGLFGESLDNVDIFDVYNMSQISLPSMKQKRAKCAATILPPTIPFHDYQEKEMEEEKLSKAPSLGNLFLNEIKTKSCKVLQPPMPPKINNINTLNVAPIPLKASKSSPAIAPFPPLLTKKIEKNNKNEIS